MSVAPLTNAVTGRHACYDRIVFTFRGQARGYNTRYASSVYSDGEGKRLDIRGGAKIAVTLLAPAHDRNYRTTYPHRVNEKVANTTGYRTLRDLVYGGTFEGQTVFGVGVRARLPYRVWTVTGPGSSSRIVIDIRHTW